jgi:group I intron endonuclease
MNCGLYKIVNEVNEKFYIGSSDNIPRRFSRHVLDLKKNRHDNQHLQSAWNKYGSEKFVFEIYKECERSLLLEEEQKELNTWVGKVECYNIRKDARRPVSIGEHRSKETIKKISQSQKGKLRWTLKQKRQMSIDRKGRKHTSETIEKFKNRATSYINIKKAQQTNVGRTYSDEHRWNMSIGRMKNKIPTNEYKTIGHLYLSGVSQRQLSIKYGITERFMGKILKKLGVK